MSVNRQLDFSLDKPRKSIEFSPQKPPVSVRPSRLTSITSKGKNKRPFDLSIGADAYEDENSDALNPASATNGMIYDDDDIIMEQPTEGSAFQQETPVGNNGEDQLQNYEAEENVIIQPQAAAGAKAIKRKLGKPAAAASMDESQLSLAVPGSARPRGRPPKKSKTEIYQDPDAGQSKASSKRVDSKRMPPPKLRDPNIKTKGTKKNGEKAPSIRSASVGPRSSFFQRSETPATDSGALITRSGRQSIKPLQTWLGEKVVMGDRTSDSLPAIKEVVRVQEVIEPPRRRQQPAYRRTRRRARSHLEDVEEEGDEDDRAEWELDPGIMVAEIMDWDPNTNKYDEEMTRAEGTVYNSRSTSSSKVLY
jgi:centromere protein C